MCGILGVIGDYKIDECTKALEQLKERGPDGSYSARGENYYLGISRLAIVAPQDELLPFVSRDKNIFCIVNGEIYNQNTLRKELIKKGHFFKTGIDTEVVLHAYEEYGFNFVKKLNGIFSIIIFDKKINTLFAARDHLGIKPLYYTKKGNGYYFCSLSKILSQSFSPPSSIDYRNLIKLYYRQSIPEPDTIYDNIFTIPAGSYAVIKNNKIKITKYFKIETKAKQKNIDIDYFIDLFRTAISNQSKFDTNNIAVAISDGVDSMLLGKLLNIKTLIGYNLPYNPLRKVYTNTKNFSFRIKTIDYIKYIDKAYNKWIQLSDQPPIDGFNIFLLSYGIKENTKVLYSGLGADELFNGYSQFNRFLNIKSKDELIENFLNITKVFPDKWLIYISNKLGFRFKEIKTEIKQSMSIDTYESIKNGNLLRELLIKYYLISCLLRDADNNSMHNGIELRVPYLDLNILEYSLSFNYKDFIVNNENKFLIKQSLNKLLGYTYKKEKEGFTLNYQSLLNKSDLYFQPRNNINAYRNWCLKNSKNWFLINKYENSNINSKQLF